MFLPQDNCFKETRFQPKPTKTAPLPYPTPSNFLFKNKNHFSLLILLLRYHTPTLKLGRPMTFENIDNMIWYFQSKHNTQKCFDKFKFSIIIINIGFCIDFRTGDQVLEPAGGLGRGHGNNAGQLCSNKQRS